METQAKTAIDKIRKGIINLQKPQPFFAYLLMMMQPKVMGANSPMPTIGVDIKGHLHYDEKWVEARSDQELEGVLCHETLHVALLHMLRTGTRNKEIANIAQDVVVNMMVRKSGLALPKETIPVDTYRDSSKLELGEGVIVDVEDVSKKSWEEVYSEIMEAIQQSGKSPQPNRGGDGLGFDNHMNDDGDGNPLTQEEQKAMEQKWQGAIAEAANYAKQMGKLPGGMERYIDELLKPQVKWRALLLQYLKPYLTPVDWSYSRPSKKSQVLGVFLPITIKEHTEVEVIVDTSGSIAQKELTEFLSEIVSIAKSMTNLKMYVSFVDTAVRARYLVDNGDIPKILAMKPVGGGGTSMEKGLDYIKEKNSEIPVAIVFTDGYDSWNKKRTDYPFDVIWVINPSGISESQMQKIPYGVSVKMK